VKDQETNQLILDALQVYFDQCNRVIRTTDEEGGSDVARETAYATSTALLKEINARQCERVVSADEVLDVYVRCQIVKRNDWSRFCEKHDSIEGTVTGGAVYESATAKV
jgi:hypothetical protein